MGKRGKWKVSKNGSLVSTADVDTIRNSYSALTARLEPLSDVVREGLQSGRWASMGSFTRTGTGSLLEYLRTRKQLSIVMTDRPALGFAATALSSSAPVVQELTVRFEAYEPSRDAVWLECVYDNERRTILVDALRLRNRDGWSDTLLAIAEEAFNAEPADAAD